MNSLPVILQVYLLFHICLDCLGIIFWLSVGIGALVIKIRNFIYKVHECYMSVQVLEENMNRNRRDYLRYFAELSDEIKSVKKKAKK